MAKAFSVASWNVEHLNSQGARSRVSDVVAFIEAQQPDVLAIYEVEGKRVWRELMDRLAHYSFFITEGANTQEILLGTRAEICAFVTQKTEFQSRDTFMRPGAVMTVLHGGHYYTLLFLHLASMPDPRGFGLRSDMIDRALSFKTKVVDKARGQKPSFIFLGDLNTMGLDYVYGKAPAPSRSLLRARATAEQEVQRLAYEAGRSGMRVLTKSREVTWRDKGRRRSNLDHVVADKHLEFSLFDGGHEVDVRGWPQLASQEEQQQWIERFSDHALLYFEVQEV